MWHTVSGLSAMWGPWFLTCLTGTHKKYAFTLVNCVLFCVSLAIVIVWISVSDGNTFVRFNLWKTSCVCASAPCRNCMQLQLRRWLVPFSSLISGSTWRTWLFRSTTHTRLRDTKRYTFKFVFLSYLGHYINLNPFT